MRAGPISAFVGVCFATLALAAPAQATFPGENGKIAFFREDQRIYVVDPDGSNLTRITSGPGSDINPAWSADGTKFAFSSGGTVESRGDIWYTSPDGTGTTRVLAKPRPDAALDPTWSPDGTKLAYANEQGSPAFSWVMINVVKLDGTGDQALCCGLEFARHPSWSPDGTKIAFSHSPLLFQPFFSIWTMNADGSNPARICCDTVNASEPDWSPDGRTILFRRGQALYRMNPDGTGLAHVYSPPAGQFAGPGAWAPDGTRIVFSQGDDVVGASIYTIKLDGTDLVRVTHAPSRNEDDAEPNWQPIPAPKRGDYKNAAKFCKAEQEFWGDQFQQRYGGGANAYGMCVSGK